MTLSIDAESATEACARLERELAHVTEQCRTAHAMAMDWRTRCLAAEAKNQRLEKKYLNLRRRKGLEHVDDDGGDSDRDDEASSVPAVW